jgi:hypothetical protein
VHFADIRALDAELKALASEERKGLVHFLRRLDLLDRERAYADLNCASAFESLGRELYPRAYPHLENVDGLVQRATRLSKEKTK